MLFDKIKTGTRIEITLEKNENKRSFTSHVEVILRVNELLVAMPISYGQLVKLPKNEKYNMTFFIEGGTIRFKAEIAGYKKEDTAILMAVRLTDDGERIQQRKFFRFACLLPMKFTPIASNETQPQGSKPQLFDGIIKDLSAGGIRFITNANIEENNKIKCMILLAPDCIIAIGSILRKEDFQRGNYKYQYMVQFVGLTGENQEKIIQYIFNEQRKALLTSKVREM